MSVTSQARRFRLRACTRCSGDAYVDSSDYEPEWRCLQCGRNVQPEASMSLPSADDDRLAAWMTTSAHSPKRLRSRRRASSARATLN